MKALIVGGTGVISLKAVKRLIDIGWEVTLLNRGNKADKYADLKVRWLYADIHNEADVQEKLGGQSFDAVCDFIVFDEKDAQRDMRLFAGKTRQYVFISSASAYQKPVMRLPITENTPLCNPYWEYSRKKAACEAAFMKAYREKDFPVTIVRPSHTYCEYTLPVQLHGGTGPWPIISRMRRGKSVPVADGGEALWTATTAGDFAVYFCALLGNPKAIGQAYHITSDKAQTWNQMYRAIAKAAGGAYKPCYLPAEMIANCRQYDYHGPLLGDKANSMVFDLAKVQRDTGLGPIDFTDFETGARRSVQYFLDHPELQKEDSKFEAFCDQLEAAAARLTQIELP